MQTSAADLIFVYSSIDSRRLNDIDTAIGIVNRERERDCDHHDSRKLYVNDEKTKATNIQRDIAVGITNICIRW